MQFKISSAWTRDSMELKWFFSSLNVVKYREKPEPMCIHFIKVFSETCTLLIKITFTFRLCACINHKMRFYLSNAQIFNMNSPKPCNFNCIDKERLDSIQLFNRFSTMYPISRQRWKCKRFSV